MLLKFYKNETDTAAERDIDAEKNMQLLELHVTCLTMRTGSV